MPSVVLGNPVASGGVQIVGQSGQPWPYSGVPAPIGGVQLLWISSGGNCYIGFSGNMTINSGQMQLSGGANSGITDGMLILPGTPYFVPRLRCGLSGNLQVFALCDVAASGNGRLYWDWFSFLLTTMGTIGLAAMGGAASFLA